MRPIRSVSNRSEVIVVISFWTGSMVKYNSSQSRLYSQNNRKRQIIRQINGSRVWPDENFVQNEMFGKQFYKFNLLNPSLLYGLNDNDQFQSGQQIQYQFRQ